MAQLKDGPRVDGPVSMNQVHRPDPSTGSCVDCGATRNDIDDRVAPVCYAVEGSNKQAIFALREKLRVINRAISGLIYSTQQAELQIIRNADGIELYEQERRDMVQALQTLGDTRQYLESQ